MVLDAAHNVDGAARLRRRPWPRSSRSAGSVVIVVGLLQGRDPAEMLEALGATEAGFVVACTPDSPRAIPAPELAAAAERLGIVGRVRVRPSRTPCSAPSAVATDDDLVLVTGSLYVVGPARRSLLSEVDA